MTLLCSEICAYWYVARAKLGASHGRVLELVDALMIVAVLAPVRKMHVSVPYHLECSA